MENRGEADFGTEMFWIGGDGEHGLGAGFEQEIVDDSLVLIGDIGDQAWQRKDQMEVTDWKQFGLASGEPISCGRGLTLGAMPIPTAVISDHRMVAVLAARHVPACSRIAAKVGPVMPDLRSFAPADRDMAAECCGPATLDRAHHLELAKAQMASIGGAPGSPVVAENIRDLQLWTGHRCGGLRRL